MSDAGNQVFVNGAFVDRSDARLSAFDAGIQHGIGLFETVRATCEGERVEIHGLEAHLQRLHTSAMELALTEALNIEALGEAIEQTVRKTNYRAARVRLTLTGGDLNLLRAAKPGGEGSPRRFDPTLIIDAQPATTYPAEMYEQGVLVTLANARCNPLEPTASHKTLNYWWRLRELQIAAGKGAAESLVFQVSNHAAGGCVSNLVVVKDGVVRTPIARGEEPAAHGGGAPLPSPVLPGVVRSRVLALAEEQGLEVQRRMLTIDDVLDADELMLTNSSWGVLPVVRVETTQIAGGKPGPMARSMLESIGSEPGMQGLLTA